MSAGFTAYDKKKNQKLGLIPAAALLVSFVLFLIFMGARAAGNPVKCIKKLEFICGNSGSYPAEQAGNGGADKIRTPGITMKGSFSENIPAGENIHLYIHKMKISILQNGKGIYSYGGGGVYPKTVRSPWAEWSSFVSPGISTALLLCRR